MEKHFKKAHLETVRQFCEDQIPFNKELGLKVQEITHEQIKITFAMQDKLVGNPMMKILHGGVISSTMDVTGGMMGIVSLADKLAVLDANERIQSISRFATIDVRVDYLSPGKGEEFTCTAKVLRSGNKIVVTRMELHNEENTLIATGTGTYVTGL